MAVKQLKARDDADGATILAELEHEVTILSQLRHPSIVQCIGATDDLDAPWIVMEFLDATLYEAAKSAADAAAVARLLAQVAAACAYLHSRPRPIVHRDLKPPNVLVDGHGRCKLADFGTAAALAGADATLTECIGTALYMAPEVEAAAAYGVASDVFAFGAMAFEVYYYRDTGDNFYDDMNLFLGLEVLREPVTAEPQQMPSQPDGCDDATWAIVCECLAADAAKRPTAQACAERLRGGEGDAWLARASYVRTRPMFSSVGAHQLQQTIASVELLGRAELEHEELVHLLHLREHRELLAHQALGVERVVADLVVVGDRLEEM